MGTRMRKKFEMRNRPRFAFIVLAALSGAFVASPAPAQSGVLQRPMPNVLLLVDNSGSMERMPDGSLPAQNAGVASGSLPNACTPGVESRPNRWGMLLQALTGNMQPFFSCAAQDRSTGSAGAAFRNEYKIAGVNPYDTGYALPYHRPLTGTAASDSVCALGPSRLPGAITGVSGVGPQLLGYAGTGLGSDVRDFPSDALVSARFNHMLQRYGTNSALSNPLGAEACVFDQARDGQLDAARDYVRFAMMTFDSDERNGIGVNGGTWPPQGLVQLGTEQPFLGMWSYRRDPSNPDYSAGITLIAGAAEGRPVNCQPPNLPFDVGARHHGAPPWEGRMVPFPAEDASLDEIQRVNEEIQRVLVATRPYGATPLDGLLDDARDYLWYNENGPRNDGYIKSIGCRDQYIILLTDGAPNLNLRPSCQFSGNPSGVCPFKDTAAETAGKLFSGDGTDTRRVTTFVIGFSVNGTNGTSGDGFPAAYSSPPNNTCKAWYSGSVASGGGGGNPATMATACITAAPRPGTTADACCKLNEIAFAGSGGAAAPVSSPAVGPYFAESQSDIVLAFGRILANVTKFVSTRTVPVYTPAVYSSSAFGSGATSAQYLGSFIPNAQKPWSGELFRERSVCGRPPAGGPLTATPAPASVSSGDSMAVNLSAQSAANRLFVTFLPDAYSIATPVGTPPSSTVVDAARTLRPFASTSDGVASYSGQEFGKLDWNLKDVPNIRHALEIDRNTCKRSRNVFGSNVGEIPALDKDDGQDCTDVVMAFVTAHVGAVTKSGSVTSTGGGTGGGTSTSTGGAGGASTDAVILDPPPSNPTPATGTYDFNIRCRNANASPSAGRCSITFDSCNVADSSSCGAPAGQVCVPDCSPLGAIFRANPFVNGPPDALLRDPGYQAFQARRAKRKPTVFAATADGILHAFKALETQSGAHHELWSFLPPAVLPRLASNYPTGNQILLDGSPVVKDTVWERSASNVTAGSVWHTTLVAGLGTMGGGYYAVNVTDSDCNAAADSKTGECASADASTGYEQPTKGSLDAAGAAAYDSSSAAKRGPHFLWQLTDIPQTGTTDPAKVVRRTRDGVNMVSLFGRTTGTPAITTVQVRVDGTDMQVGVAILPGGVDGPPVKNGSCNRISTPQDLASDIAFPPRTSVRQWASQCTGASSAVPGRGVTIVRLDNGQILRHFGREGDVPKSIWNANVVTASPFDSPVIGTPVVYPQTTGAVAQKIFVGDADGTIWRIDVTSSDPKNWKVMLFADLIAGGTAADSQPIQVTPILSLAPGGALVLNAATGDQESIVYRQGEKNYVWSITEQRPGGISAPSRAAVQWYETLMNGERVTGPMTVFDQSLYFATFSPRIPAQNQCTNTGIAKLWGLHYLLKDEQGGGKAMWCRSVAASGVCNAATGLVKNSEVPESAGSIIPGVTLRATQACSEIGDVGQGAGLPGFLGISPSRYQLSFGIGATRAASQGFPPGAMIGASERPLPRVPTTVNAWALVID
jgi:hypothetical protein